MVKTPGGFLCGDLCELVFFLQTTMKWFAGDLALRSKGSLLGKFAANTLGHTSIGKTTQTCKLVRT
jgi:hypothetical protein